MTVVTDDLVELHRHIALLEGLVNHLRLCRVCADLDVMNCELGVKLWEAAKPDIKQTR